MSSLSLTMIILNYKDYLMTEKLLEHIMPFDAIDGIVVVDNHSDNGSYEALKKHESSKCKVIKTDKNGGYAYGNNRGIEYAIRCFKSDIISILNPDVFFSEETVLKVKELFAKYDYALLSPIMYNIDGTISKRPYWDLPSYKNDFCMCFSIYRKLDSKKIRKVDYSNEIMNVDVLPGSFLCFRKEALLDVGMLDQTLFLYCEERMISHKLLQKGYKCGLITSCRYDHMHSVTTKRYLKEIQINRLMSKARYYYEVKYNKINSIKRLILLVAMQYSNIELCVSVFLKGVFRIVTKNKKL